MAELEPRTPQSIDPDLQANLVRLLQIKGPLGILNVPDVIVPVVIMGEIAPRDVITRQPRFDVADWFSAGITLSPAANSILADTGQLPAGVYDVIISIGSNTGAAAEQWAVQHRDAANAANLGIIEHIQLAEGNAQQPLYMAFSHSFVSNERLRILNTSAIVGSVIATILCRIQ